MPSYIYITANSDTIRVMTEIRPTPKQERFIVSSVDEIFYGGARGGGKTYACLLDFAGVVKVYGRDAQGILFRRTYKELEEAIKISKEMYRGRAVWRAGDKQWTFKNGAALKLRALERDDDVEKYQGHSYTNIYFDELGNYPTDYPYLFMFSSLRSAAGVPCYMRATGNPGGIGAYWVKERFITNKDPERVYSYDGTTRTFIPARLEDNPLLAATDYDAKLRALPEHLYRAFRLGDWDVFAGQVFSEWDQERHIVEPFPLDPSWYRFASMDWGYAKPYSIGFWAKTHEGRLIRYHEMYGALKPNEGTKERASAVAAKAGEMAAFLGVEDMVADPACWSHQGFSEESIEQIFSQYFVMLRGNNDRISGAFAFHDYLKTELSDGGPMMCVFPGCKDFIRTIPAMTADKKRPEDVDTRGEDHAYDEARYAIMHVKDEVKADTGWTPRQDKESLLRRKLGNGR